MRGVDDVAAGGLEARPKVTVAMAVYNGTRYLGDAVASIRHQNFKHFELLIVDDGSNDGSAALAGSLAAHDPRIRVLAAEHGGIAQATNRALHEARGEFFAPMDQDDVALPDRLALLTDHLDRNAGVVALSGGTETIDASGSLVPGSGVRIPPRDADAALRFQCALVHPASMMRTDVMRALGGYRPAFSYAHDYDLFLRLAEVGEIANLPQRVLQKRRHARQATARRADRPAQVIAGAVAYMSRLSRRECGEELLRAGETLEEAGARFIVTYLSDRRALRPDVVHHFSRFLRYAPLAHEGRNEPLGVYLRYLAAAARIGGPRELLRSAYYVASFHLAERAPRRLSRPAASMNAA